MSSGSHASMDATLRLGLDLLSPDLISAAVENRPPLVLDDIVIDRLNRAHELVRRAADRHQPIYGLTTGVGSQARSTVGRTDAIVDNFNRRMVLDHAGGVGPGLNEAVCYAIALVRVHNLALAGSGVSSETVRYTVQLLNDGVVPLVHSHGSVGASDLAACASLAAAWCFGVGSIYRHGIPGPADSFHQTLGRDRIPLTGKDGLSLISANALSLGYGSLLTIALTQVLATHLNVIALSFEAFGANLSILDTNVHEPRHHSRQAEVAASLRDRLRSSYLWDPGSARNLQDPLSFRCVPQVVGALAERIQRLDHQLTDELNTRSDNPIVLIEQEQILSNGNFDTTDLCLEIEAACQALCRVVLMAERRIDKLVSTSFSGLPQGLSEDLTAHGYTVLTHTAASLASEAQSISAGSITQLAPIEEGIEDVGSMAPLALSRLRRLADIALTVTAVEALVAARAGNLRGSGQRAMGALTAIIDSETGDLSTPGSKVEAVKDALTRAFSGGARASLTLT